MSITLSSISSDTVKMRWKEPYASDGLNRKVAVVIPAGVYRGLRLGVSSSPLSVDLSADPIAGDHVVVQESFDGHSTTYRDDASGTITLSLAGFTTGDVVVVVIFINYTSGSTTAAEFRGYELSEYNGLSASVKAGLVVLGTVLRPASGIIPVGNIVHDRRKIPFLQRTDEATPWNPIIRNGGFELGQTNGTYRHASPFWKSSLTNANFTFRPVETEAHSGVKSLELTTAVAGAVVATIQQDIWMPVTPGRFIMGRLYKKAIQTAITSPTGRMRFLFGDKDGLNDTQDDLVFTIASIDGGFVEFDGVVQVPTGMMVLKAVQIIINGTYGSTGPCIRIDDVGAWAQVEGADWLDVRDSRSPETAVGDMFLGGANSFANASAKLSFDGTSINVERRDEDQTKLPPAVSIPGRAFAGGIQYTLVFQSAIPTTTPGVSVFYRKYVNSLNFSCVETVNASFNNTTTLWSKDVTGLGVEASKNEIAYNGVRIYGRSGSAADDSPWADSAWKQYATTAVPEVTTVANPKFSPLLQMLDAGGNRKTIVDHNGLLMGRQAMMNETWWRADPAGSPPLDTKSWTETDTGSGGSTIGPSGIARIDVGATATNRHSLRTTNDQFIPMGDSDLIVAAEWEWSPNNVNVVLPQCKAVMGFFSSGPINLLALEGIWIGARESDTNWQFASQFSGGSGNYWTDAAGAFGNLVDTGVAVSSLKQRMRVEVYGANSSFGGHRALAYINGNLVGEIDSADLPFGNVGWGMEIYRMSTTGTRSMSVGPLKIVHNRRIRSDDVL